MVKPQIKKEKRKHKKVVTLRQYTFFKVKTSHTHSLPSLSFLVFTTKNTKRVEFSNISNLLHYHTTTTFPWLPKPISTLHVRDLGDSIFTITSVCLQPCVAMHEPYGSLTENAAKRPYIDVLLDRDSTFFQKPICSVTLGCAFENFVRERT